LFNLRTDPYEQADITSNTYWDWLIDRIFLVLYGSAIATQFLQTFKEFPPRQGPASFTINNAVEELDKFLASRGG
jgi:arylsulfatase